MYIGRNNTDNEYYHNLDHYASEYVSFRKGNIPYATYRYQHEKDKYAVSDTEQSYRTCFNCACVWNIPRVSCAYERLR